MSKLELIEMIIIGVIIIILAVYYFIKAIKNKWLQKIYNEIKCSIAEAEETGLTGPEKKQYVLDQIEALCKQEGIPYEFIKKLICKAIDKIVEGYNAIAKSK